MKRIIPNSSRRVFDVPREYRSICPEARPAQWQSFLSSFWWSILLLCGARLFHTNASFAGLARSGQEWQWGAFTASVCFLQLVGLLGASVTFRFFAHATGFFLWSFIALQFATGAPQHWHGIPLSTGAGVYAAIAFMQALAIHALRPFVIADASVYIGRLRARRERGKQ